MKVIIRFIFIFLFLATISLFVFRGGMGNTDRVGGDEVASYISLFPFVHGLAEMKIIPTILIYYHEPIQQIIQLPVMLFGSSVFFVRLPNILFGILTFILLYKIGRKIFGSKYLYIFFLLNIYSFSGFILVLRMGIDAGLFNFILALCVNKLIDYHKNKDPDSFKTAILFMILNLFVFIDGIFLFGFIFLDSLTGIKIRVKIIFKMWRPFAISALVMSLWAGAVYVGAIYSGLYDWRLQAPFRLISRGTAYSLASFLSNLSFSLMFNSVEFTVALLCLLAASIFDKRARLVWSLLAIPFIYFNLVKMPTLHILNFWVLIVLAAALGFRYISEKIGSARFVIMVLVMYAIIQNIKQVRLINPFDADVDYKIAATYLRQNSDLCEKIYIKTSLDGYAFRFYFDRGYVTDLKNDPKTAFTDGSNEYLESNDFGRVAEVVRNEGPNFIIYKRGYSGVVKKLNTSDEKMFNFSNTLTYVTSCLNK